MLSIISGNRGKPLGTGTMYPAGSICDHEIADLLSAYKRDIAGAYISVSPDEIPMKIPSGHHIASTKIDGEQWFIYKCKEQTVLLASNGKAITGIPLLYELNEVMHDWTGILAGELYAIVDSGRPRVFDLHSAMGGASNARIDALRFVVFDIIRDVDCNCQPLSFDNRAKRIQELLESTQLVHAADFTEIDGSDGVVEFFKDKVHSGEEGIVVRCADGRIFKIKPQISIDAVVVGYTATSKGVNELLLALMPNEQPADGKLLQLIGRVDIGFSAAERRELADRLAPLKRDSPINMPSRSGLSYQWVRPKIVVEVTCHELLAENSDNEPIRRWRVTYNDDGWKARGKAASISMRDAVFIRVRDDKAARLPDVRFSQATDIVDIPDASIDNADLPRSEIIRREVYTKRIRNYGIAVRKFVVWKTNKDDIDPRYSAYVVMFTDYSPARQEPIATQLRTASTIEHIAAIIEKWFVQNIRRGWDCVSKIGDELQSHQDEDKSAVIVAGSSAILTISFAKSTSPIFPIVRKRLDTLSELGQLCVTADESGKEVWFELHIHGGLVQNYRRIANLLSLVHKWKSIEIAFDGELLDKFDADSLLERLEDIRRCWSSKRRSTGSAVCRRDCDLGCRCIHITPSQRFLEGGYVTEPRWYTVGHFDGKKVTIDKDGLVAQVARRRNKLLDCCPMFDRDAVISAINNLSDVISPADVGYEFACRRDDGLAVWVWPEHASIPSRLTTYGVQTSKTSDQTGILQCPTKTTRMFATTYADVCGQSEAIEAVKDMVELPMKHGHLFEAVGASVKSSGVILAGPPGTGKTLLARAVAGECGASLEIVSGPELLNPFVGATEKALREVFERASRNTPSLILFDEIDSIAPARATADSQHQQSMVAQLLTLLDGLEARDGIYVLATTNRPNSVDPALRRPGRFDRVVWMKLPDESGRAAILKHYLKPLKLDSDIDIQNLGAGIAASTNGASGADLEYLCQTAARICVKDALSYDELPNDVRIFKHHFDEALTSLGYSDTSSAVEQSELHNSK